VVQVPSLAQPRVDRVVLASLPVQQSVGQPVAVSSEQVARGPPSGQAPEPSAPDVEIGGELIEFARGGQAGWAPSSTLARPSGPYIRESVLARLHPGRLAAVVTERLVALADGFTDVLLGLCDERVTLGVWRASRRRRWRSSRYWRRPGLYSALFIANLTMMIGWIGTRGSVRQGARCVVEVLWIGASTASPHSAPALPGEQSPVSQKAFGALVAEPMRPHTRGGHSQTLVGG